MNWTELRPKIITLIALDMRSARKGLNGIEAYQMGDAIHILTNFGDDFLDQNIDNFQEWIDRLEGKESTSA